MTMRYLLILIAVSLIVGWACKKEPTTPPPPAVSNTGTVDFDVNGTHFNWSTKSTYKEWYDGVHYSIHDRSFSLTLRVPEQNVLNIELDYVEEGKEYELDNTERYGIYSDKYQSYSTTLCDSARYKGKIKFTRIDTQNDQIEADFFYNACNGSDKVEVTNGKIRGHAEIYN